MPAGELVRERVDQPVPLGAEPLGIERIEDRGRDLHRHGYSESRASACAGRRGRSSSVSVLHSPASRAARCTCCVDVPRTNTSPWLVDGSARQPSTTAGGIATSYGVSSRVGRSSAIGSASRDGGFRARGGPRPGGRAHHPRGGQLLPALQHPVDQHGATVGRCVIRRRDPERRLGDGEPRGDLREIERQEAALAIVHGEVVLRAEVGPRLGARSRCRSAPSDRCRRRPRWSPAARRSAPPRRRRCPAPRRCPPRTPRRRGTHPTASRGPQRGSMAGSRPPPGTDASPTARWSAPRIARTISPPRRSAPLAPGGCAPPHATLAAALPRSSAELAVPVLELWRLTAAIRLDAAVGAGRLFRALAVGERAPREQLEQVPLGGANLARRDWRSTPSRIAFARAAAGPDPRPRSPASSVSSPCRGLVHGWCQ